MQNKFELAVVIPVFNEEKNIVSLIHDWQALFTKQEITPAFIIVNDGSTDNSYALLKSLKENIADFKIISHSNKGHGPSLIVAYKEACGYEWVFQIDSDHDYQTTTFTDLWCRRQEHDFLLGERKEKTASIGRRWISYFSKIVVHLLYGKSINDVNSPYRLMRGSLLQEIINKIPPDTFAPNILITGFSVLKKRRIHCSPLEKRINKFSKRSKLNLYFIKGSLLSIFQTIGFRFRI